MSTSQSLFLDLQKAYSRLSEIFSQPFSEIVQDATIQRFEFTFVLTWKLLNVLLREKGVESFGPKETIRNAAKAGLIHDAAVWLTFLEARNLTTHTYKQEVAREIFEKAKEFVKELGSSIPAMEKAIQAENSHE